MRYPNYGGQCCPALTTIRAEPRGGQMKESMMTESQTTYIPAAGYDWRLFRARRPAPVLGENSSPK
jgi:hypothetical protein